MTEPQFSAGLNVAANAWNKWDSDLAATVNRLRWFESTAGATGATFGAFNDPDWSTFINSMSLTGADRPSSYNRSDAVVRCGTLMWDCMLETCVCVENFLELLSRIAARLWMYACL